MKEAFRKLISAVQIEDVRLVEATASARVRAPIDMGAMTMTLGKSATISDHFDDGTFFILATIDASLASEAGAGNPEVAVKASFELRYKLPEDFTASDADLSHFAEVNGVYNAWPYWREFIQNAVLRMNLPPLVLPVFRIGEVMDKDSAEKVAEV